MGVSAQPGAQSVFEPISVLEAEGSSGNTGLGQVLRKKEKKSLAAGTHIVTMEQLVPVAGCVALSMSDLGSIGPFFTVRRCRFLLSHCAALSVSIVSLCGVVGF